MLFSQGKLCLIADGVYVQSLEHPGCVWDAKFLEHGDIVTACSDGVIRIWTVDQDNIADTVELEAYASELSQYKLSRYDHITLTNILCLTYCCIMIILCVGHLFLIKKWGDLLLTV